MLAVAVAGAELEPHENPEMAKLLRQERERLCENIELLERSRRQVECYLDRVQRELPAGDGAGSAAARS